MTYEPRRFRTNCQRCGRLMWVRPVYPESPRTCLRCLPLVDAHDLKCDEEVADGDGIACPCERFAVGYATEEDGHRYPVCAQHMETT